MEVIEECKKDPCTFIPLEKPVEDGFVHVKPPTKGETSVEDKTTRQEIGDCIEMVSEKSSHGASLCNESLGRQETGDSDPIASDPVILDLPENCDVDTQDVRPNGINDHFEKEMLECSQHQSNGIHEETQPKENAEQGNKVALGSTLITSLTPFDETYLQAVASKKENDLLFVDTQGSHSSADGKSSSSDPIVVDLAGDGDEIVQDKGYRENLDSSVSDLSSFESDSDIEIEIEEIFRKGPHMNKCHEVTTHGELTLKDLPPIQDLKISVPEGQCIEVGIVSSIVNELVVVQALPNKPALDLGTILFLNSGKDTLGEVFDVFGPVKEPYYTVRFNSEDHARKRGVMEGVPVFCAPKTEYTSYVFVYDMLKMKGSDASWEHNHEPPLHCLDYSDDEKERASRKKKGQPHQSKQGRSNDGSGDGQEGTSTTEADGGGSSVENQVAHPRKAPSKPPPQQTGVAEECALSEPAHVHWRQALTPSYQSKHPPPPCNNGPINRIDNQGSLHPPGHPPLRGKHTGDWHASDYALRSARRANRHLFRDRSADDQVRPPQCSPMPCTPSQGTPSQGTPSALMECPMPKRPTHEQSGLLPTPSTWVFGSSPQHLFPPAPPEAPCLQNPFSVPPPQPSGAHLFRVPPPIPTGVIVPHSYPDAPGHNPSPLLPSPLQSAPPASSTSQHPFSSPQPLSPNPFFPSFQGPFERRNSMPPSFPPPRHPPFISRQMSPFVLRPSSLFTKHPPPSGPNA
ncbi:H/ACA ribonucleoprotein complex non-core subunit NAF1 [Ischnura elegans]|uniref:H/ACA ribonucleoprotein complex non-core subunit NAF1 n=1 Tax=Ischnura elegans TaxID=197161 RepID=UPI001ED8AC26|nr:H/ACA ribonucleoprotein complex non-core subunit NAF1 [Ischnura elegans]